MTIATIMGTALVFIAVGWTGKVYEPMALVIGGMICIAAANAGATSQDLKQVISLALLQNISNWPCLSEQFFHLWSLALPLNILTPQPQKWHQEEFNMP